MIRLLVEEYGADVLLPIKLQHDNYSPKEAILTLVLTLSLPKEKAKEIARLLLELGATTAQADMNHFTALHYFVFEDNSDLLDVLLDHDGPAAQSVLNYVSIGQSSYGTTAITYALKHGHEAMVSKLLSIGGKPTITFDDYIKPYLAKYQHAEQWSAEQSMDTYRTNCLQPLLIAAEREMPKIMEDLIARGADPSTLDATAYRVINDNTSARWQQGFSVLDIVRAKLEVLRDYRDFDGIEPEKLRDESFYLQGLKSGDYQYWTAKHQFREAKEANTEAHKAYQKSVADAKEGKNGAREKKEAISQLIREFEVVEKRIVDAGVKTFKEMYPDIPEYQEYGHTWGSNSAGKRYFTSLFR